jgi:peptide/nickel transport system substrate-binding protein
MYGPLSRYTRCYWDGAETAYAYDPDKAKALLDEAGWVEGSDGIREKDGQKLSLVGVVISSQELLEYLGPKLQAVGVDLKIELVPGPVQLERAIAGDFDLMFEHLSSVEPDVLYLVWYSENLKPGGWAWSRFKNDRVDELLDQTKQEADPDKRCELFVEVQQIVTENVPALPTVSNAVIYAMSSNVKGFQVGGAVRSYFYINNMYIEE